MNPEISRTFPKNNAHKCAQHKTKKQQIGIKNLICTPNTGHLVLGVFLCDTVTSTRRSAWNCTDKGNGQKHQTE